MTATATKPVRKFAVGDRVWDYRPWDRVSRGWRVVSVEKRSYVVAEIYGDGSLSRFPEKVSFAKAEHRFQTNAEHEEAVYIGRHRYRIAEAVRRTDVATLRKVAQVIGYDDGEGGEK